MEPENPMQVHPVSSAIAKAQKKRRLPFTATPTFFAYTALSIDDILIILSRLKRAGARG